MIDDAGRMEVLELGTGLEEPVTDPVDKPPVKPRAAKVATEGVRTYEIELAHGGAIRVDIPESYKVTYGPIIGPGSKGGGTAAYRGGNAFRAWENDTKQRLLLTDVVSFRDVGLPMKRRAVRKFGSETWVADDGKWTGQKSLEVQKSWVPIDQIDERPPEDEVRF